MSTLSRSMIGLTFLAALSAPCAFAQAPKTAESKFLDRGRYLVKIAGCNDCHTVGYAQAGGRVPEKQWLTGDRLGWRGSWGTTYAANLRLFMQNLSEDEWVRIVKTAEFRPPMPWFALHDMTEHDLRAIYRFIRYLGPSGDLAPAFVPPGQEPKGAYVQYPSSPK